MRTEIDIDEALLAEAMRYLGLQTKEATVEQALRHAIRLEKQKKILELYGTVAWEGDLDAMREGRDFGSEKGP